MNGDTTSPLLMFCAITLGVFSIYSHKKKVCYEKQRLIVNERKEIHRKSVQHAIKDEIHHNIQSNECTMKFEINHLTDYLDIVSRSSPLYECIWPLNRNFVGLKETIIETQTVDPAIRQKSSQLKEFVRCGARQQVYFDPKEVRAAIVTCGGLCPGLNTVIREIVMALVCTYGCEMVYGVLGGYQGFQNQLKLLTPENVSEIHQIGGTVLRSSRGGFDIDHIIDCAVKHGINQLYIIGGDGTHRGALKIANEIRRRKLAVCVAAIPKTIDNDIAFIDQSFGFATSVSEGVRPITCAAVEAQGAPNGIGLIKLMGRHSGFIAMHATLAARQVDACLIPEMDFKLEELCEYIKSKLESQGNCVIVVAEGAGQNLLGDTAEMDPSGNPVFSDIGIFLKQYINKWFNDRGAEINLKYIDPTYMIRSLPANASDSFMCSRLAFSAVHGCMAGFTNFSVGIIDHHYVMLPISAIAEHETVKVDITGRSYSRMCMNTGQPTFGGGNI